MSGWWVFSSLAECVAAELEMRETLLPDVRADTGAEAPIQVTTRWAEPAQTRDLRWAILAKDGSASPAGADMVEENPLPALVPGMS